MAKQNHPSWTPEEEDLLRETYRAGGFRGAHAAFGGSRTKAAIQTKAQSLDIDSQGRWTAEDIQQATSMKAHRYTNLEIALKLGRTEKSVALKMRRLGLLQKRGKRNETPTALVPSKRTERAFLAAARKHSSVSKVATEKGIPYKMALEITQGSVGKRRVTNPWETWELNILKAHYLTSSREDMEWRLPNHSRASIAIKASSLGLTRDRRTASLEVVARRRASEGAHGERLLRPWNPVQDW